MEASRSSLHKRRNICSNRPLYRDGRKERAVKVFTINQESRYLLVQGVPDIKITDELLKLFSLYGIIEEYRILDNLPAEEFTKNYWVKYADIQAARVAKRKMDDHAFYGGFLHVAYAPEYESIPDTREKLQQRRVSVARRLRKLAQERAPESTVKGVEIISPNCGALPAHTPVPHAPKTAWSMKSISAPSLPPDSSRSVISGTRANHQNEWAADFDEDHQDNVSSTEPFPTLPAPPRKLPPWQWDIPSRPEFPRLRTAHDTLPAGFIPFPDGDGQRHHAMTRPPSEPPRAVPGLDQPFIGPHIPPEMDPRTVVFSHLTAPSSSSLESAEREKYLQSGARPKLLSSAGEITHRTSRLTIGPSAEARQMRCTDSNPTRKQEQSATSLDFHATGQEQQIEAARPKLVAKRRLGPNPVSSSQTQHDGDNTSKHNSNSRCTGGDHPFLPRAICTRAKRSASTLDVEDQRMESAPASGPKTGDASFDQTVSAVRQRMPRASQVAQTGAMAVSPLDAIIIQLRNRERIGMLPRRPPVKRQRI